MSDSSTRINKFIADNTEFSRRKAEEMIRQGVVFIDSKKAELGDKVTKDNKVTVAGELIKVKTNPTKLLLYYKPVGEICTKSDPQNRKTVFDSLPDRRNIKWQNVGRLDINSEGLLLFTNNGELLHELLHPKFENIREYRVRVYGEVNAKVMQGLTKPIKDANEVLQFKSIKLQGKLNRTNNWFTVSLMGGKNREIRRIFAHFDLQVSRLIRVKYGDYELPRDLKPGDYLYCPII